LEQEIRGEHGGLDVNDPTELQIWLSGLPLKLESASQLNGFPQAVYTRAEEKADIYNGRLNPCHRLWERRQMG
jgi:hypothetical protein